MIKPVKRRDNMIEKGFPTIIDDNHINFTEKLNRVLEISEVL